MKWLRYSMVISGFETVSTVHSLPSKNDGTLLPTALGRIASFYYLHNGTVKLFSERLDNDMSLDDLLLVLTVRHTRQGVQ